MPARRPAPADEPWAPGCESERCGSATAYRVSLLGKRTYLCSAHVWPYVRQLIDQVPAGTPLVVVRRPNGG